MNVYKNSGEQFPITIELNSGFNRLTVDAAKELYMKLGDLLEPLSDHAVLGEVSLSSEDKYKFMEIMYSYFGKPFPHKMDFHFFNEVLKHFRIERK
ncbi:MAG: hypothetical protein JSW06_02945 [Thermoplasmatales archaeon]|nr:MAG: hypothetical protein JSW06_02945 [Thermoplasmatales archaeon]